MSSIKLSKEQAKSIAQVVFKDISNYTLKNYERYFPWLLNERRKTKVRTVRLGFISVPRRLPDVQ